MSLSLSLESALSLVFFFFFFSKIALCLYRVLHCTIATYYIMHLGIYRSASVPSTYVSVPRPTVV